MSDTEALIQRVASLLKAMRRGDRADSYDIQAAGIVAALAPELRQAQRVEELEAENAELRRLLNGKAEA